jgi:hypothetical protein
MSILSQLSSQCRDRTEESNVKVAFLCVEDHSLLDEIRYGLNSTDDVLSGDCAEVMTKVAEENPALIVPFVDDLIAGLSRKKARVRWESIHALALIADRIPDKIGPLLERIDDLIHQDQSVVVQHYSVVTLGNYASAGNEESQNAFPYLKKAVFAWDGKFAAHAIEGLIHVTYFSDFHDTELSQIAIQFIDHRRVTIRQAARNLMIEIDKKTNQI